jgi:GAF domain-containing protein
LPRKSLVGRRGRLSAIIQVLNDLFGTETTDTETTESFRAFATVALRLLLEEGSAGADRATGKIAAESTVRRRHTNPDSSTNERSDPQKTVDAFRLGYPIEVNGEVLGTICALHNEPYDFDAGSPSLRRKLEELRTAIQEDLTSAA